MQQSKTSSTNTQSLALPRGKSTAREVVEYDPMDDFVFSMQDPHAATREKMASAARKVFGDGPENTDFIAKLVEHMLAVSESRSKIVSELVILGGHLQQIMQAAITHHTGKVGNTFVAQKTAATLAFDFFQTALKITRSSARGYIRCHQKFGDDAEAISLFSYGELNLLSVQDVTEDQLNAIKLKKTERPELTRAEVKELLKTLQRQEEAIDDRDKQLDNIQGLLEDNKVQLDVATRESNHLKQELAEHERHLAEKDKSLATLRELLTTRTSGYGSMEKELADKGRLVADLTAELKALQAAKPKVETVEVPVEKLPDAYANVSEAVAAALDELKEAEARKSTLDKEITQLQASIATQQAELEADTAVRRSLDDLTNAWADVAGKMATVQLAIQASSEPGQYTPTLDALAGMLRKYIAEIEAALNR
jgi:myosin heavy subunit